LVSLLKAAPIWVASIVTALAMGPSGSGAGSDRDRVISLYNIHTQETASILYKKDGKYVASGMEKVNWLLRDWRKNETISMDPELIDLLWEMHNQLGSRQPIHIISGYRSRATNEMLRHSVGGQASQSRHILGRAADVHFPDVPLRVLRYAALVRERGGVGYYPTSAIPFVHVDTDRVRAWPRLPRYELALLFPQGRTHHLPTDGVPISRDDVRIARTQHKELVAQVAQFRDFGKLPKLPYAVADAGRSVSASPQETAANPSTLEAGLLRRPLRATQDSRMTAITGPPAYERDRMTELAALASTEPRLISGPTLLSRRNLPQLAPALSGPALPTLEHADRKPPASRPRLAAAHPAANQRMGNPAGRFGWGSGWVVAPAYDDEHPEELSYRPFPIAPLLTASAHEPLFAELVQHDVARTVAMLDQPNATLSLRFRPGEQLAQLMWAQEFRGDPIGLTRLYEALADPQTVTGVQSRSVRTTGR
jgi:uncharacterized protein YcbK (DUF882 family)